MKKEFEMTEQDLKEILKACKPVRYMIVGDTAPASPQENANDAWKKLGKKLGFIWDSVEPIPSKGDRFFTAIVEEDNEKMS